MVHVYNYYMYIYVYIYIYIYIYILGMGDSMILSSKWSTSDGAIYYCDSNSAIYDEVLTGNFGGLQVAR